MTGVEHMEKQQSGRWWLWAVLVVALGIGLRWANLGGWDLWTDEVQTLWVSASGDFKEGPLYRTAPLNFLLTGWSLELLGEGILAARAVPFLAGAATIALFFPLMRRWVGQRAALFGTLVLALSFWHVGWSQTARHFALEVLLLLGALHGFLLHWREGSRLGLGLMGVLLLAALFTHSSSGFVLAAILTFLVTDWLRSATRRNRDTDMSAEVRSRRRLWAVGACVLALSVYLPMYFEVGAYLLENKRAWNPPFNILGSLPFYVSPVMALFGLAGAGFLKSEEDDLWILLLWVAVLPPLLATTAGAFTISSGAYALPALLAVAALAGVACDRLLGDKDQRNGAVAYGRASIVMALFLSQIYTLAHYYLVWNGLKPRWSEAVAYVERHRQPGERFWASEGDVAQYYAGPDRADWIDRYGYDGAAGASAVEEGTGGWFAVYLDPSPGPFGSGNALAPLRVPPDAEVEAVFPLHYGAKDRTIVVLHLEPGPAGSSRSAAVTAETSGSSR